MNPSSPGGMSVFLNTGHKNLGPEKFCDFLKLNSETIGEFLFENDIPCVFRFSHQIEDNTPKEVQDTQVICEWMQKEPPFRFPRRTHEESNRIDRQACGLNQKKNHRLPKVSQFFLPAPPDIREMMSDTLIPVHQMFRSAERQRDRSIRGKNWVTLFVLTQRLYREVCYRISELPNIDDTDAETMCRNEAIRPGLCLVAKFENLNSLGIPTGMHSVSRLNPRGLGIPIERRVVRNFLSTRGPRYPVT